MIVTSGDVSEALSWLTNLDRQYNLSNEDYGMGDFIDDLRSKGYITDDNESGEFKITAKSEQEIRKSSLEEIFGKLKNQEGAIIPPILVALEMRSPQILESFSLVIR